LLFYEATHYFKVRIKEITRSYNWLHIVLIFSSETCSK
jgi:hypothetical protein